MIPYRKQGPAQLRSAHLRHRNVPLFLLWACLLAVPIPLLAKERPSTKSGSGGNEAKGLAAGCLNPENSASLELNNVRTLIYSGGDMWWDRPSRTARYEIPKGSGKQSLYLGSLWIGGMTESGTLKIAAQTYSNDGPDYYTGPLSRDGEASVDQQTCKEFDKIWKISRAEVARHRFCMEKPNDPQCAGYAGNIPQSIMDWPAISFQDNVDSLSGGLPSVQYHYAPFIDVDGNENYDPENGDYPAYDLDYKDKCMINRTPFLYGDETLFWIFNDKGNIHYETGAEPIGLEVRAQAFAFATNDEINNMTFYNYEIINRGSLTLENCYFGVNTDADLGYAPDDYVGCDVMRGFGYVYNGDEMDGQGAPLATQYGNNPPAVGIDFFEGPYADRDGVADAFIQGQYDTYLALNGLGYGDTIVDNERIGMRRFMYYSNTTGPTSDPGVGIEFYNVLRGLWKNGAYMYFGGSGYPGVGGTSAVRTDFMFPGDSDPLLWGTRGVDLNYEWTQEKPCPGCPEEPAHDQRFVQSAGPFTLLPGAVNDITTGAVWARAYGGTAFESVELVRKADDKAQQLFENCFRLLNGPDAPDVTIQELDRELILYWTNSPLGNNKQNTYVEEDYSISKSLVPDSADRLYKFQGFLVYQVLNGTVTAEERHDLNKARLIAQCDLKDFDEQGNPIATMVNYTQDQTLNIPVAQVEVQGSNTGIFQSLRVLEDAFATGADKRLVNHKNYYFLVLAYAHNNYKTFDPSDPAALDGQKKPFLAGRKGSAGAIRVQSGIPHITAPETYGTVINSFYGDMPEITRIEGNGNGGNVVDLTPETEAALLQPPYFAEQATYRRGAGPVKIKVVDPLALEKGTYYLALDGPVQASGGLNTMRVTSRWALLDEDMDTVAVSDNDLSVNTEQLLFNKTTNEFMGLSVVVAQTKQPGNDRETNNGFLQASLETDNPADAYLGFVPDNDIVPALNWILSGSQTAGIQPGILPDTTLDDSQSFERVALGNGGALAPYALSSRAADGPRWAFKIASAAFKIETIQSVDLVLTPDRSKWSRVPVLEIANEAYKAYKHPDLEDAEGIRPRKMDLRRSPSVDQNGVYATQDGTQTGSLLSGPSSDPEAPNYISEWGMGWFPGYAVSVETGERLNLAFGEDSYLASANGRDMLFNPTGVSAFDPNDISQVVSEFGDAILGGKHFIYIFGTTNEVGGIYPRTPRYDAGVFAMQVMKQAETELDGSGGQAIRMLNADKVKQNLFRAAMWTGIPVAVEGKNWLSGELRVRMRVAKPYMQYSTYVQDQPAAPVNDNRPLYRFSLDGMVPVTNHGNTALSALDLINVVPNPYYAYSAYEKDQLDNRVKITNLPPECTISIYNVSGTLVRRFIKGTNQITSVEWDLKNYANIPISGGIYIIHIRVPGVGERVIKWFGVLRPTDLSDF